MEFKEAYVWVLGSVLTCGALLPVAIIRGIYLMVKKR